MVIILLFNNMDCHIKQRTYSMQNELNSVLICSCVLSDNATYFVVAISWNVMDIVECNKFRNTFHHIAFSLWQCRPCLRWSTSFRHLRTHRSSETNCEFLMHALCGFTPRSFCRWSTIITNVFEKSSTSLS